MDLSENLVKETGATALAEALNTNASLTSLSLRYNGIRSAASKLATSLTSNTTLNSLDLKQNDLSQVDLIAIAAVIGRNTTLMTLELGLDASTLAAAAEEVVSINRVLERNRDRAAEQARVEAAVYEAWTGHETTRARRVIFIVVLFYHILYRLYTRRSVLTYQTQ